MHKKLLIILSHKVKVAVNKLQRDNILININNDLFKYF